MSLPSLSVTIAQRGKVGLTRRAIGSLRRGGYPGPMQILVFDNDSPPGAVERLGGLGVEVVRSPSNLGFGPAHNHLAALATGELLLILNNDVLVAPGALERLVARWARSPRHSAAVPQFRSFDGATQELGVMLGPLATGWQLMRGGTLPAGLARTPVYADYGSAAALLVSRSSFLEVGGFDDAFAPAYYEDSDLALRLRRLGGEVVVEPRAVVFHLDGATSRASQSPTRGLILRNRARFLEGWHETLRRRPTPSSGAAITRSLAPDPSTPRVLWLHPGLPRPNECGGDARVWRILKVLRAAGWGVALWTDDSGDHEVLGERLSLLGIPWFGPPPGARSARPASSPTRVQLDELLRAPFDLIVAWSHDVAARHLEQIRTVAPRTPLVADLGVLGYLQAERAAALGGAVDPALVIGRAAELGTYRRLDGLIGSSCLEKDLLFESTPGVPVTFYDVGAYPSRVIRGERGCDAVFLGSFLHPPNIDAVSFWHEEIGPRVSRELGREAILDVVGTASDVVAARAGWQSVRAHGWQPSLDGLLGRARMFVAPLRYGAGTKDKIALAVGYGLPVVTTSIGAEAMPVEMQPALHVEDTADGLARRIAHLLTDERAWRGATARARWAARVASRAQHRADRRLLDFLADLARGDRRAARPAPIG